SSITTDSDASSPGESNELAAAPPSTFTDASPYAPDSRLCSHTAYFFEPSAGRPLRFSVITPGTASAFAPPGRFLKFETSVTVAGHGAKPLLITFPFASMSGPTWIRTVGFCDGNWFDPGT